MTNKCVANYVFQTANYLLLYLGVVFYECFWLFLPPGDFYAVVQLSPVQSCVSLAGSECSSLCHQLHLQPLSGGSGTGLCMGQMAGEWKFHSRALSADINRVNCERDNRYIAHIIIVPPVFHKQPDIMIEQI